MTLAKIFKLNSLTLLFTLVFINYSLSESQTKFIDLTPIENKSSTIHLENYLGRKLISLDTIEDNNLSFSLSLYNNFGNNSFLYKLSSAEKILSDSNSTNIMNKLFVSSLSNDLEILKNWNLIWGVGVGEFKNKIKINQGNC